jgi:hypothetical protein
MSLAIAVRIPLSSVRSSAGGLPSAGPLSGSRRRRPSRRSPSRRCRAPAACHRARSSRAARRGKDQRFAILGQRLRAQLADLGGLHQHRAPHVLDDRLELMLALGQERVEEARRAGVVGRSGVAAGEQPAVVEEHVDELPQHVVERLDQLLADVAVLARRDRTPTRRRREKAIVRQPRRRASSSARAASPPSSSCRRRSRCPRASREQLDLRAQIAALAGERRSPAARACRRSPGCTNSTATWRASERAAGERPNAIRRPPRAKRSAIRWHSRASRSASAAKNSLVGSVRSRSSSSRRARLCSPASAASASRCDGPLARRDRRQPVAPGVDALAGAGADEDRSTSGMTWSML